MNSLNSVLIEGNMVRDPLIRLTQKGTSVCNFTIASNRYYRQESGVEQEVGFFDVEAWGKLADACASHGRKGKGVRVVGRLKQDRWVGSDGKNRTKTAIVAEHVEYRVDLREKAAAMLETENPNSRGSREENSEIYNPHKSCSQDAAIPDNSEYKSVVF